MVAARGREKRRTLFDILSGIGRHAASIAVGLVTFPLIGSVLGVERLGIWGLLGASTALVALGDLGLSMPVQRAAVRQDRARAHRTLGTALRTSLIFGPLISLMCLPLLTVELAEGHAGELPITLCLVLAAGCVSGVAGPYRAYVIASGGMRALAAARVFAAVVQILITAGLLFAPSMTVPALALLAANVLELLCLPLIARRHDPGLPWFPPGGLERSAFREAVRDAAAALVLYGGVVIAGRLDVFLVSRVAPLGVVAAYAIALRAVEQSFVLAKQTSGALLPKLGAVATRSEATELGTGVLGALVGAGMCALVMDGGALLRAWTGGVVAIDSFGLPLALLACAAVVAAGHEVACSGLTLGGRTAWSGATPLIAGSVINVALGLTFSDRYGVVAIAGATVFGNLVTFAWVWARARRMLAWTGTRVVRSLLPGGVAIVSALFVGGALSDLAGSGPFVSLGVCALVTACGVSAGGIVAWRRHA